MIKAVDIIATYSMTGEATGSKKLRGKKGRNV